MLDHGRTGEKLWFTAGIRWWLIFAGRDGLGLGGWARGLSTKVSIGHHEDREE